MPVQHIAAFCVNFGKIQVLCLNIKKIGPWFKTSKRVIKIAKLKVKIGFFFKVWWECWTALK